MAGNAQIGQLVLGIANSGGGCLVVGVCETPEKKFDCNGVAILRDKADIDKQLRNFLPQPLMDNLAPQDFSYEGSDYGVLAGKSFQTLIVLDDPSKHSVYARRRNNRFTSDCYLCSANGLNGRGFL